LRPQQPPERELNLVTVLMTLWLSGVTIAFINLVVHIFVY